MSNSDEAVSSVDSQIRKTRKKRDIFFVGIVGAQHAVVQFSGADLNSVKAEAEKQLETELGKPAKTILGPYYQVKGAQNEESDRATVTVAARDLIYTGKRFSGEYKNWKVIGTGLKKITVDDEDYGNDELVSVMFEGPVDPENKTRKPRMKANDVLRAEDIENLQQI